MNFFFVSRKRMYWCLVCVCVCDTMRFLFSFQFHCICFLHCNDAATAAVATTYYHSDCSVASWNEEIGLEDMEMGNMYVARIDEYVWDGVDTASVCTYTHISPQLLFSFSRQCHVAFFISFDFKSNVSHSSSQNILFSLKQELLVHSHANSFTHTIFSHRIRSLTTASHSQSPPPKTIDIFESFVSSFWNNWQIDILQ